MAGTALGRKEMMKMNCSKCGGLMIFEEFARTATEEKRWLYEGWRCVHCGEIIDPVILLNRKKAKDREAVSGRRKSSRKEIFPISIRLADEVRLNQPFFLKGFFFTSKRGV